MTEQASSVKVKISIEFHWDDYRTWQVAQAIIGSEQADREMVVVSKRFNPVEIAVIHPHLYTQMTSQETRVLAAALAAASAIADNWDRDPDPERIRREYGTSAR